MKRLLTSLIAVFLLAGIAAVPMRAADEQTLTSSVTVGEVVSITLTDAGTQGINFGTLSPGAEGGEVAQNDTTPAVAVIVGSETTVNVDIGIKGEITGSLSLDNWKYSKTFDGVKTSLTGTYVAVYTNVARESSNGFWHWVAIPAGTAAGTYNCAVYYKAVKTGTSF